MPALALDLTRPPKDAVEFFDAKGTRLTWSWLDMLREDHDLAFTVAKATSEEVLGAIRTQVAKAINEGMTFQQFKRTLKPTLQDLGWWGRQEVLDGDTGELTTVQLGSDRRLRTIYSTNIQTAYMAGRYKRMVSNAVDRPYWRYIPIMDGRARKAHAKLKDFVARWDSPVWRIISPPNGFGCRCRIMAMTEEEFRASGLTLRSDEEMLISKEFIARDGHKFTAQGLRDVLEGGGDFFPDEGWDYNPGDHLATKARLENIREEKALMAKRAQKAAQAAVDKLPPKPAPIPAPEPFDISTPAGKWHKPAWDGAPKWLRDVVVREQDVGVQQNATQTAWALDGHTIDMDGHTPTARQSQNTWRHEFGHILDWRVGGGGNFASSGPAFHAAATAAAAALSEASALRRVGTNATIAAYNRAVASMMADPQQALQSACAAVNLSVDDFIALLKSTPRYSSAPFAEWPPELLRSVAGMLDALTRRDVESFLRRAGHSSAYNIDGATNSLSDLVGALTRNDVCSPEDGFPGHSTSYYTIGGTYRQNSEAFANLTALAGHPTRGWWAIVSYLMPDLARIYERTLTQR